MATFSGGGAVPRDHYGRNVVPTDWMINFYIVAYKVKPVSSSHVLYRLTEWAPGWGSDRSVYSSVGGGHRTCLLYNIKHNGNEECSGWDQGEGEGDQSINEWLWGANGPTRIDTWIVWNELNLHTNSGTKLQFPEIGEFFLPELV